MFNVDVGYMTYTRARLNLNVLKISIDKHQEALKQRQLMIIMKHNRRNLTCHECANPTVHVSCHPSKPHNYFFLKNNLFTDLSA